MSDTYSRGSVEVALLDLSIASPCQSVGVFVDLRLIVLKVIILIFSCHKLVFFVVAAAACCFFNASSATQDNKIYPP